MGQLSLGETIRKLREEADMSLRELAEAVKVSPPFLSDVELGRRIPGDEKLEAIARQLKIPVGHLKQLDQREHLADFKRMIDLNPELGLAFRAAVDGLKSGKISPEKLAEKLGRPPPR